MTALVAVLGLGLTGCGNDVADKPSASTGTDTGKASAAVASTPPMDGPKCATVWVRGAKLPQGYQGCMTKGGFVKRESVLCESGQVLVTFGDRFYAAPGYKITRTDGPLKQDRVYRKVRGSCTA